MKKAVRVIVFLLIFAMAISFFDNLLCRKETDGWWNVTAKLDGFYNSPKNEYDMMYFGSSNTYCSFNPLVVWKERGIKSYVFATQQQPVWATYHYMADAFKTQHPKVAVVDILMFSKNDEYYDDGVNYTFCDNMPFSLNKIELVRASVPKGQRFNLLFRFMKYHSRWNDLKKEDFLYKKSSMRDYSKGYYVLTAECDDAIKTDTEKVTAAAELSSKNLEYLQKIIDLCNEKGIELMLVKTPSNSTPEETEYFNAVAKIAKQNGIFYCDYNQEYKQIGLDIKTDFFDKTHLNTSGAEKFSKYFADNLPDLEFSDGSADKEWECDYNKYLAEK
ncbi:MAG: hypothetical protein PUB42_06000 [Firmicutes bacterium]|nr:hypothetical protein [Bacillota bacterium]